MKPTKFALLAVLSVLLVFACVHRLPSPFPTVTVTLEAQTVPATVHASWTPDAPNQNVTQYQVTLDGGSPIVTQPSACSSTNCLQALTIPTFASHTVTLVACNQQISTDPTSLQCNAPPLTITFVLNQAPSAIVAGTVTK